MSSWHFPVEKFILPGALITLALASVAWAQQPDPKRLFEDAREAQQRGDQALAAREYQQLIQLRPDMTAAHANLAAVLVSLGRLDEAIPQYRAALEQAPGDRALQLNLGLAYFRKGDLGAAAGLFSSLHQSQPHDAQVATLLGDCDLRLGRDAQAVSLLTPLEEANPDNLYLEWVLGSALIRAGLIHEGVERVEKVAQQRHSVEAYISAAEANLKIQRFEQARRDVAAARRLDPHLPDLDTLSGKIMEYSGDLEGAAAAFEKALHANPRDFQAQLHLGSVLYTERQLDAATLHLDRALEIDPASSPTRYELALVERAQGRLGAAVRDLEQAERDDPGWLSPHIELSALYYRLNRPQDGAREKQIVDRLTAQQQQREFESRSVIPQLPSQ